MSTTTAPFDAIVVAAKHHDAIAEIAKLHEVIMGAARSSIASAMRIGELLTQQKADIPHGGWLAWVRMHMKFSQKSASNYMRVYDNREMIESKLATLANLNDAYKLLAEDNGNRTAPAKAPHKFQASKAPPVDIESEEVPTSATPPAPPPAPPASRTAAKVNLFNDDTAAGIKTATEEMATTPKPVLDKSFDPLEIFTAIFGGEAQPETQDTPPPTSGLHDDVRNAWWKVIEEQMEEAQDRTLLWELHSLYQHAMEEIRERVNRKPTTKEAV